MKLRLPRRKKKQHPLNNIAAKLYKAIDKTAKQLGDTNFKAYGEAHGIILFVFLKDGNTAVHRVGTWNLQKYIYAARICFEKMLKDIETGEAEPVQK